MNVYIENNINKIKIKTKFIMNINKIKTKFIMNINKLFRKELTLIYSWHMITHIIFNLSIVFI